MKANRFRFRAWMKDDHQMRYIKMWSINCLIDADDIIPMQSTGLLDKNGVEIFEGDVVSDHIGIGAVEYSDKNAGLRVCYSDGRAKWFADYNLKGERESIEVIGNVHENPELLEEI